MKSFSFQMSLLFAYKYYTALPQITGFHIFFTGKTYKVFFFPKKISAREGQ